MDFCSELVAAIDEVNLQILRLLQGNGRLSLTDLAAAVGRSESTTRERVSALERDGLLMGYQARVDWSRIGLPALAVVRAACAPDRLADLTVKLARMPHVTAAMILTGPKPVLITLRVRDMAHLHSVLREELATGTLRDIEALVALEVLVEQRPPGQPLVRPGSDLLAQQFPDRATDRRPPASSAIMAPPVAGRVERP